MIPRRKESTRMSMWTISPHSSLQQEAKHMNFNRPWYDIHAYRLPTMVTELQIEAQNLGQIQKESSRVTMF